MPNVGGNGYPFPFFMVPPQWGQDQPRREEVPELSVPARVRQAMMFIELCAQKTQQKAAVSESQIQLIDGQILNESEQIALDTACNLLTKYFAGQTGFDKWERLRFEALKQKVRRSRKKEGIVKRVIGDCPSCKGFPPEVLNCPICEGLGSVEISPVQEDLQRELRKATKPLPPPPKRRKKPPENPDSE